IEPELLKIFSAHGKVVELINAMNETIHHDRTIAVDWSLPKDKYLEAMKS
ncbi:16388_t:CDS:2, partial [Gigaspora margarita]